MVPDPNGVPTWAAAFLDALKDMGIVSRAAAIAGVSSSAVSALRQRNADFDAAFEDAMEEAIDKMETEARRRAVDGVEKTIYYQGEVCGYEQVYSDSLLMFLLKGRRRAVFGDKQELTGKDGAPLVLDSSSRAARVAQLLALAKERREALPAPTDPESLI